MTQSTQITHAHTHTHEHTCPHERKYKYNTIKTLKERSKIYEFNSSFE